jgi:hypothetical protein
MSAERVAKLEGALVNDEILSLRVKESTHAISVVLNFHQFEYVARIMASSAFTDKNKSNLLKYLANNLQTILTTKEFVNRHIKIVPYLLVAIFIVR